MANTGLKSAYVRPIKDKYTCRYSGMTDWARPCGAADAVPLATGVINRGPLSRPPHGRRSMTQPVSAGLWVAGGVGHGRSNGGSRV